MAACTPQLMVCSPAALQPGGHNNPENFNIMFSFWELLMDEKHKDQGNEFISKEKYVYSSVYLVLNFVVYISLRIFT